MAKAIRFHKTGGPEVLSYEDVDVQDPGPGEARIKQHAAGLNFIDTYHRTGYYPVPGLPSGIGVEAAGVVDAVGEGVAAFKPGDRVAYVIPKPGAYAELNTVAAEWLVPIPDWLSFEAAAAIMLKGMTARYLLRTTYAVKSGDTILVHAAAGGVGLLLCRWAAHLGAQVIGTVGSQEKAELAQRNGCHVPVLYREENVVDRVMALTEGEGVPVVYDSVGRSTFLQSMQCLRRRGIMVSFGQSSGSVEAFDPVLLSRHGSLFLTRPTLFHHIDTPESLGETSKDLFRMVEKGVIPAEVRQRFPLKDAAEAHRALEGRRTTGSTVLVIE